MTSLTQISTALYRYLCQHVVGTEETVKTKRMLNAVYDSFQRVSIFKFMTSGSFGEGLEMEGSDLDIMIIERDINIYDSINSNYDPNKINFIMDTKGTKPGFTKLKWVNFGNNTHKVTQLSIKTGNDFYLSNILVKKWKLIDYRNFTFHGPCLSDGTTDLAYTLQSKTWITPASHWLHRAKNQWPIEDVKAKVAECGVLFVPIGVKGSDKEEIEWRISFSAGEKLLIYSFSHTQLLCYALMKILLKDIIERDSRCKNLLCSYYMKTILFWVSEEQPLSLWIPENLIQCFLGCFQRLIYCVKYSICPHYFIPENNMFENRIDGFVRQVLLENLNVLYSDGWGCLLTSQQMFNFKPLTPLQIEFNAFQDYFRHIINSGAIYRYRKMPANPCPCENCFNTGMLGIKHFLQYQSSNIKSYCVYGISLLSHDRAQVIQLTTQKENKETYKPYNTCLAYLLLNTHHDAVSGWLMLASFFYKMKQYRLALYILLYSMSKCSPEKIQYRETLLFAKNRYRKTEPVLKLKTWKSMGLLRTMATLCLEPLFMTCRSKLIPNELEMFVKYDKCIVTPPVVFAHFLCFLCRYHLHDVRKYNTSLSDLYLTITYNLTDIYIKNCCLGIAYEVVGDYDSARDAYFKAATMDTHNVCRFALQRLSMIDKK